MQCELTKMQDIKYSMQREQTKIQDIKYSMQCEETKIQDINNKRNVSKLTGITSQCNTSKLKSKT